MQLLPSVFLCFFVIITMLTLLESAYTGRRGGLMMKILSLLLHIIILLLLTDIAERCYLSRELWLLFGGTRLRQ